MVANKPFQQPHVCKNASEFVPALLAPYLIWQDVRGDTPTLLAHCTPSHLARHTWGYSCPSCTSYSISSGMANMGSLQVAPHLIWESVGVVLSRPPWLIFSLAQKANVISLSVAGVIACMCMCECLSHLDLGIDSQVYAMTHAGLSDPVTSLSMAAPPGVWSACGVVLGYMVHDCFFLWMYGLPHLAFEVVVVVVVVIVVVVAVVVAVAVVVIT